MKHTSHRITLGCVLAILFGILPVSQTFAKKKSAASPSPSATSTAKAAPSTSPGAKMVRVIPFHGMISAVDNKAKTFTIAGKDKSRIFKVSDQSVISKGATPGSMKDVAEKEEVRGTYWKETDGTLMAKMVKVGPLTEQEKAAEDARKAKRAAKKAAKTAAASSPSASPSATASPKP